jgi:hypothetical protein
VINNFDICIESIVKKHFFIEDIKDKEPAEIKYTDGEFEVINHTNSPINFLKIDSCVYSSSDTTRSDCAVYNDNTFCFIELKCIKPKNFTKKRKEAEEQLEATIRDFQDKEIVKNKNLEAYVCSNCIVKVDEKYEEITKQPKNKEVRAKFEFELNTIIYYSKKKEFN